MRAPRRLLMAACLIALAGSAHAATITIVNLDSAGEGFNDATPVVPVGGNPGTTVGAQRLYVFQYAANIWGGILPSTVEIKVNSNFNPLAPCDSVSGVLGSAGPTQLFRDFTGATIAGHWYHVALANKLFNGDLSASNDINAQFNSSVGTPTCLNVGWYYGVDGNEGSKIELLPVVLHELGHGLGFSTTTTNGVYNGGYPHVWDHFLYDNSVGLHWDQMTQAQRTTSSTSCNRLSWDGAMTTSHAAALLNDKPVVRVTAPAGIAGDYDGGPATFGPSSYSVNASVVQAIDGGGASTTDACEAITNSVAGKIALVDRGNCPFAQKTKNAQNAGAVGVILADNVAGCPAPGIGGTDATITIPTLRVTQADGNTIKASLGSGVSARLTRDPALQAGADGAGRVKMYAPSSFLSGSSVSHFDVTADPDLLMEPAANYGLSSSVDLTQWLLGDIGWLSPLVDAPAPTPAVARLEPNFPNPFAASTAIHFTLARDENVDLSVYDLNGRRVASLRQGSLGTGEHAIDWNGRAADGSLAAPGIYLYRLRTGKDVESRHMVLMR